jgi:hypothetical protein
MICSGDPKGVISIHPFVSNKDILKSNVKGVADMQYTRDIGRRYHHGEVWTLRVKRSCEKTFLCPLFIPVRFYVTEIIGLGKGLIGCLIRH